MSASFTNVPVVDVNVDNVESIKPCLEFAIADADFIAIDCVKPSVKLSRQLLHNI
jgi:hypothetical protein